MATMIHYDLPEELQKFGGLTNDITIQHFKSYANLLFDRFGDRVKLWITFNEPANLCLLSYGTGDFAPQTVANGIGEYLCGDIVLKAHALVYRLHKEHYASQNGKIGITLSSRYFYSPTNSTYDVERALQFYVSKICDLINCRFNTIIRCMFVAARLVCAADIRQKWRLSRSDEATNKWQ